MEDGKGLGMWIDGRGFRKGFVGLCLLLRRLESRKGVGNSIYGDGV